MRTMTLLATLLALFLGGCGYYSLDFPVPVGDDDTACDDDDSAVDTGDDDTAVDTGDDDTDVEDPEYTLVFTVTANAEFLDFSYGYCSDVEDAGSCADWHQSDVDDVAGPTVVSNEILVLDTGSGRLNSTYTDEAGAEVGWFCQLGTDAETGETVPQLTGTASVAVNGLDLGDGYVITGVLYGNGCSGGYNVTDIIDAYLVATGG